MSAVDPAIYGMQNLLAVLAAIIIPLVIALIVNVVFGVIAVNMAKSRELRPVPAFFVGFFTGFIGLFYIALTPRKY